MPLRVLAPVLPPPVEACVLVRWLVAVGDVVRPGDVIAEIETASATFEVEAADAGTVSRLLVAAGTRGITGGQPIAVLESGSGIAAGAERSVGAPSSPPGASTPAAVRQMVSPVARALAADWGIDLATVHGSGPGGRIVRRDIERARGETLRAEPATVGPAISAAREPVAAYPSPPEPSALAVIAPRAVDATLRDRRLIASYAAAGITLVPHDAARRAAAERQGLARQTIPHLDLVADCRADALEALRDRLNHMSPPSGPRAYRLSRDDILLKALALALQQVPDANVVFLDGGVGRLDRSDVSIGVGSGAGGQMPVVRHADLKSLSEISNEVRDLSARAAAHKLAPEELEGGSTALSSLGALGVDRYAAPILPPHATALAVGAAERRPVVTHEGLAVATVLTCTLSCDLRVVDAATAAALLGAFKAYVEEPVRMLV